MSRPRTLHIAALALAFGAAAATAGPAEAASSSTSTVSGVVGSELSLSAGTPSAMNLTHAAAATATSAITVTSTQAAWTLSIADQNTGANAGKMIKTAGTTPLSSALQWSPDGTTFSNLSATPATVGTGSLVGTKNVTFKQALTSSDQVAAGDSFGLTVAYTVTP